MGERERRRDAILTLLAILAGLILVLIALGGRAQG